MKFLLILMAMFSPSLFAAEPVITGITGNFETDSTLTITGSNFTAKTNAAPLFYWQADSGQTPSSLGRKLAWDSTFYGSVDTALHTSGRTQSVAVNHGSSEKAALGRVDHTGPDLYVYRRYYENFDPANAWALRSWVATTSITGGAFKVGDTVTGLTSGAVGVIDMIYPDDGANRTSLFFTRAGGTFANSPPIYFKQGEAMRNQNGVTATNVEPFNPDLSWAGNANIDPATGIPHTGLYRMFNYKTIRNWNASDAPNYTDIFFGYNTRDGYSRLSEYLGNPSWWYDMWQGKVVNTPFQWSIDEFYFRASTINTSNGAATYYKNGVLGINLPIITRTTAAPSYQTQLYMTQVSNGAQSDTVVNYDSLYVDDTWHHVMLCPFANYSLCHNNSEIQIPTAWTDTSITISLNLGTLSRQKAWYLYVVNGNGEVSKGYSLCSKCPSPPTIIN